LMLGSSDSSRRSSTERLQQSSTAAHHVHEDELRVLVGEWPVEPSLLQRLQQTILRAGVISTLWAIFSVALSYYNSWLLNKDGQARFPDAFFYTMWHMIAQFFGTSILFCCRPKWPAPSRSQFVAHWRLLLGFTMIALIQIGSENWALTCVTLTVHESIKSAVPVLTMVLAFFLEARRYTPLLIVAIVALAVCSALVAVGSMRNAELLNSVQGVVLSVVGAVAAAARPVFVAILLRASEPGQPPPNTPLVLVWYEAIVCTPLYLLLWVYGANRQATLEYLQAQPGLSVGYIAAGSAMAFCFSLAVNELIQVTSALTSTVLGTTKHVVMASVSTFAVDRSTSAISIGGVSAFAPSLGVYAYLMLTGKGTEPWSRQYPDQRSDCGDACLRVLCCVTRPHIGAPATPTPSESTPLQDSLQEHISDPRGKEHTLTVKR